MLNSVVVTSATTVSIVITSAALGFAFAKIQFIGRDLIFVAFLATMALPFEVLAIPLLITFQRLGAVDQEWGLIVPFMVDVFAIYICRQYMAAIPNDYLDAARLDGLGNFRIFWHIVLPMSRPAVAAVAILSFLYNWDQLFWPLVSSRASRTRQSRSPSSICRRSLGRSTTSLWPPVRSLWCRLWSYSSYSGDSSWKE